MTTTEQETDETKALLESRVAALTTARAAAEIALANERAERLQVEADRELAHKLWQEDEARLERAVAAREKAEAEVTRLRGSLGVAEIRLGEGVALLERWNKLSGPTCEELQQDTWEFLSRIRAEATAALCYEGDCAKMTGRARPCPVHDAQPPLPTRAELTGHGLSEDDLAWCRRVREQYGDDGEKIVPRLFSAFERLAEAVDDLGELPVTVMATTSKYPSPAPCSGCAAARELLVLWYHNRAETESGELIEVATQNWLKEHGE